MTERKRLRLSLMDVRGTPNVKSEFNSHKNSETSVSSEDMLTSSENLFSAHDTIDLSPDMKQTDKDYVRISKQEYEEIKNRVSAIENRLSREFTDVIPRAQPLQNVQNAYEQTLEEVAMLNCPNSEHLARRLSKELKIRPKEQAKIIRSPSARKIGSIRRRSKENIIKIVRHKSWNASSHSQTTHDTDRFYPFNGMMPRERTSTVKPDSAVKTQNAATDDWDVSASDNSTNNATDSAQKYRQRKRISLGPEYNLDRTIGKSQTRRSLNITSNDSWAATESSLNDTNDGVRSIGQEQCHRNGAKTSNRLCRDRGAQQKWRSAAAFFMDKTGELECNGGSGRPSVNKLRQQNAGAVLAKAKLFESSSDKSSEGNDKMPQSGFARKPRANAQCATKPQKTTASAKSKVPSHFNSSANIPSRFNRVECSSKNTLRPYPPINQGKEETTSWRLNRKTTPPVEKVVSPQNVPIKTPLTPAVKKPLSQPKHLRTPVATNDLKKLNTPLKAVHVSPRRRSPRQKLQRSFNQFN